MTSVNQIRKDVDQLKQITQSYLVEPDWLIRSREINKSLIQIEEAKRQLTPEQMREVVQEVLNDYKKREAEVYKHRPGAKK